MLLNIKRFARSDERKRHAKVHQKNKTSLSSRVSGNSLKSNSDSNISPIHHSKHSNLEVSSKSVLKSKKNRLKSTNGNSNHLNMQQQQCSPPNEFDSNESFPGTSSSTSASNCIKHQLSQYNLQKTPSGLLDLNLLRNFTNSSNLNFARNNAINSNSLNNLSSPAATSSANHHNILLPSHILANAGVSVNNQFYNAHSNIHLNNNSESTSGYINSHGHNSERQHLINNQSHHHNCEMHQINNNHHQDNNNNNYLANLVQNNSNSLYHLHNANNFATLDAHALLKNGMIPNNGDYMDLSNSMQQHSRANSSI